MKDLKKDAKKVAMKNAMKDAMKNAEKFEIPDAMREMAEHNVEQARGAYSQFLDMARKAQDTAAKSTDVMAEGARELQARTLRFAQNHVAASFSLAADLARAKDLKDYFDIQTRYAQRQMAAYTEQAAELSQLMTEMTGKDKAPRKK